MDYLISGQVDGRKFAWINRNECTSGKKINSLTTNVKLLKLEATEWLETPPCCFYEYASGYIFS